MIVRRVLPAALLGCASIAWPGCVHDEVQPDVGLEAVCGDGIVEPGEACDNTSAGCVDCQIAPGWVCPNDVCSPICGDGVVGTGATCADPHRDSACDMTGYWAVSETDYTCDDIFHAAQTSSNWYLYHLVQSGNDFHVDEELDCGIEVTGSATVQYTAGAMAAVLYLNPMDGTGTYPPRQGTSAPTAGGCAVTLDRWYKLLGAELSYLPADFSTDPPLSSLPALPSVSDPINGPDDPPGATDPDGDGFLGNAVQITGVVNGIRDSVQRYWKEYATVGAPVAAGALQFDVPGSYALQENILHVSQCGTSCSLLATGAMSTTAPVKITFSFIGKTLGSARVAPVVEGLPRQNLQTDLATCQNVQQMLPHETTAPADACPSAGL